MDSARQDASAVSRRLVLRRGQQRLRFWRHECAYDPDHTEHDNGADFFIGAENTTNAFSVLKSRLRSGNKGHS
jgi:hypothetical protein